MQDHSNKVVKSKDVIGKKVISLQNENLGKVEEIVLDKVGGEARYIVLSFGGFMGLGDKYFAFPWKSISYNEQEESFILNVDKDKLTNAPGFNKDNWPDMASSSYMQTLVDYYNF